MGMLEAAADSLSNFPPRATLPQPEARAARQHRAQENVLGASGIPIPALEPIYETRSGIT